MSLVMKKDYLQRGMVFFLLIFALSDITSASPCGDELGIYPLKQVSTCKVDLQFEISDNQTKCEAVIEVQESQPEHSPNEEMNCEDCFCCCSHILPSSHFSAKSLDINYQIRDLNKLFLPVSPPRDTFRPPRFA
jgi:hypothetical protein